MDLGSVDVHDVLLIARPSVARALEDEALSVVAEISLRVLAPIRQLSNVAKMSLSGFGWDADRKIFALSRKRRRDRNERG